MRKLIDFTGGRGLVQDDLEVIQEQLDRLGAQWGIMGAFVISGFTVTANGGNWDISEGLAWLNGKTIHYPGETNRSIPANSRIREIASTTELPREYVLDADTQDGVQKTNISIDTTAGADGEEWINITSDGPSRKMNDAMRDVSNRVGQIVMFSGSESKFDSNGVGLLSFKGWQLCNGNNGAPNLRGKFIVGLDERTSGEDSDFDNIGDNGGAKTHKHKIGSIDVGDDDVYIGDRAGNFMEHENQVDGDVTGSGDPRRIWKDKAGGVHTGGGWTDDQDIDSEQSSSLPPFYTLAFMYWNGNGAQYGAFSGGGAGSGGGEPDSE